MIRALLFSAAAAALVSTSGFAQPQPQPGAPRPKLASELPTPKVGEKLKLNRSDVKTRKDDNGLLEVTTVEAAPEDLTATIPAAIWELDADGWFDSEGFNIARAYPRSGLWAMRTAKGNRPPGTGSGLPSSPTSLLPQAAPRLYRAGPNDVITHIDGVAVTSFERFVYAINSAANPRDLPIVVMNSETGRRHVFYVTAFKATGQ